MNDSAAAPWISRPAARPWTCAPLASGARAFHASLPDYAPTPLTQIPALAAELGVGRLFVKDESSRLGLPAFKALGASWAIRRALDQRGARADGQPHVFVCATDGNHGRAVARFAARLGHRAIVVVAPGIHPAAVEAIRAEGAEVVEGATSYDDAVERAASIAAAADGILIQDTSWPGYEQIPTWIVEGYETLCAEVDEQLGAAGAGAPDLVVVPVGVGSLAQAVIAHYRSSSATSRPAILAVEPQAAACVLASLRAGEPKTIETSDTVMAGLNCGTPSSLAWPYLRDGLDAAVAINDATCLTAVTDLARLGINAGPCGAAALAALRAVRGELDLRRDAVVVLLSTEGSAANPHGAGEV
ncbi:MAG TPA: diaminopropionate ammonia-lyase [Candidatus Limnocylindria bacterium]|nr:diaminopropionate ammonia-lyase [Candidatus Limnocylindria bacterium]